MPSDYKFERKTTSQKLYKQFLLNKSIIKIAKIIADLNKYFLVNSPAITTNKMKTPYKKRTKYREKYNGEYLYHLTKKDYKEYWPEIVKLGERQ